MGLVQLHHQFPTLIENELNRLDLLEAGGKFADLVLLDANPLEDIHNTQKIRAVILRGKLLDRNFLDEQLAKEENFAKAH